MTTQKEGYIHKQGEVSGLWNKKYCVIQYNMMMMFDKEPSSTTRGTPKSTYNLSDATVRGAEGIHRCGFQLEVVDKNNKKKIVTMAATDPKDLKDWTDSIKEAAKPVETAKREERKLPGRWDAPVSQTATDKNKRGGGGNVVEKPMTQPVQQQVVTPQYSQQQQQQQVLPQQQQYNQPMYNPQQQQYNQPMYNPQQYNPQQQQYNQPQYNPQQQQYNQPMYNPQQYSQPQQPQYNPQSTQPPRSQYADLFANAPKVPVVEPTPFPTIPQENPTIGTSSMFPNLRPANS